MIKAIDKYLYILAMGFLLMPNLSSGDETNVGADEVLGKLKSEVESLKEQVTVLMTKVSQAENAVQRLSNIQTQPDYTAQMQ